MRRRVAVRPLYRKLETTQELGENDYYKLRIEEQGPDRVTVNAFWRDLARHERGPFLSPHFAQATRNFTEMMFALSVLDLPFERTAPDVAYAGARMTLRAKSDAIVLHEEIKPATPAPDAAPVLVSQNYFAADDRWRVVDGEQVDKYVTGELLVHRVYIAQVVLTNPTSSQQKLSVLLQIPRGAIPVSGGFRTKGQTLSLAPHATHSVEYSFYFPAPGSFAHYPVHVARDKALVAAAKPVTLEVVAEPSDVDATSWAYVSQHGSTENVLRFLDDNAIERLDLERIAWRMKDRKVYDQVLALLGRRHVYDDTLWSYSVHHGDAAGLREYLLHQESFLRGCGLELDSPVVQVDAVKRGWYQHLEYAPLVNARAHRLGAKRKILNDRFAKQYSEWNRLLSYRPTLGDDDLLAVTYYHLLQDRVDEALATFARIDASRIQARLQYDYLRVYLAFFGDDPRSARAIAQPYADHPVDRWRALFREALAQLDELDGASREPLDAKADRTQRQGQLAATEAAFDFSVENRTVRVSSQNVAELAVNYYLMDIELLFSRQPFVQQQSTQFAFVKPNRSDRVPVPEPGKPFSFPLPAELGSSNVVVEVVAGGSRKAQAYYAHALDVTLMEGMGQLRVAHASTRQPLARVYVKVYAKLGSEVRFYKDGYSDVRGRFDYTSLSTDELDRVQSFAVLVLSEEHGAVIREATPPKR
jgi:hypothetical protein